jgi:hypothetical protein
MEKDELAWSSEEQIRAENDYLKMKLMLENGAEFHTVEGEELPADIENEFLKHIAAFEEQWAKRKTISIFEKIERPAHFLPVDYIPDDEIENAWQNLWQYLQDHGIHLDHCSPRVTPRELYRFTTEELFQLEIDDIHVPGMIQGYIYDEFHPDPAFDLCMVVENSVFWNIFQKDHLRLHNVLTSNKVQFNEQPVMEMEKFQTLINNWKDQYEEIHLLGFKVSSSEIIEKEAIVKGHYCMEARVSILTKREEGEFMVKLEKEEGIWKIEELVIEGFDPW